MGNPKVVPREEAVGSGQAGKRGLLAPLGFWSTHGSSPPVRCWTARMATDGPVARHVRSQHQYYIMFGESKQGM